ncbi:MAG: Mpv17/PMP22 family protein [Pedobacter sp.]
MKKQDLYFGVCLGLFFCPFFLSQDIFDFYMASVSAHALLMSFWKFAILATLGEVIGLRIVRGHYYAPGFGLWPRALVWGGLGVGIQVAFVIFATGAPAVVSKFLIPLPQGILGQPFSGGKLIAAFAVSVSMNLIFAPLFMTLHRVTDMHIQKTGGTLRGFFSPIDFGRILQDIDWQVMWGFVFKKTLPLFWIPAHTITFLLPEMHRVLFAALLGIVLGTILAVASLAKSGRAATV